MLFLPYMDVFFLKHTWYSNQPVCHGSCLLPFVCSLLWHQILHISKSSLKSPSWKPLFFFLRELFFAISLIPLILSPHLFSNCFGSQSNLPKYKLWRHCLSIADTGGLSWYHSGLDPLGVHAYCTLQFPFIPYLSWDLCLSCETLSSMPCSYLCF